MTEEFVAGNELERKLIDAHEGKIEAQQLMLELLDEQVYMPIEEKHQIEGLQTRKDAQPLLLEDDEGNQVLILFTSPDRSKAFTADMPNFKGGLLTELSWLMERIGSGIALSINPDAEVGLDLTPEMVVQLIQLNASRGDSA